MSFDIPQMRIPDNSTEARILEAIIDRDHVTVEEAVRRALRTVEVKPAAPKKSATKRQAQSVAPVTDQELKQFKELYPGLGRLDDVTDEQWDRILKGACKMNKEGFPRRA